METTYGKFDNRSVVYALKEGPHSVGYKSGHGVGKNDFFVPISRHETLRLATINGPRVSDSIYYSVRPSVTLKNFSQS